jgi:hypothetical protein
MDQLNPSHKGGESACCAACFTELCARISGPLLKKVAIRLLQIQQDLLTLSDATGDEMYTECFVLPIRWSDAPQAVQVLGDLSGELAAILVDP